MTAPAPLRGSVALVTGATQGIGRAIAGRLAADGATVAVGGPEHDAAMDAAVTALGGTAAPADVHDPAQVARLVAQLRDDAGPVDVLVANAAYLTMAPFLDHDAEDWWRVVDTNLTGTFHLIQAVVPDMLRRGHGRIVVIASEWGITGWPNATAYAASKAGLISLTKSLGRELAPRGVVVNAVAPGVIDTPQLAVDAADAGTSLDAIRGRYARALPVGRIGRPEEVADAVALLVDPAVGALVGQVIQVNGGSTRCRA